jgi:hypothetical protein
MVSLEEAEALCSALSPAERDELLQEMLTAAPQGGVRLLLLHVLSRAHAPGAAGSPAAFPV